MGLIRFHRFLIKPPSFHSASALDIITVWCGWKWLGPRNLPLLNRTNFAVPTADLQEYTVLYLPEGPIANTGTGGIGQTQLASHLPQYALIRMRVRTYLLTIMHIHAQQLWYYYQQFMQNLAGLGCSRTVMTAAILSHCMKQSGIQSVRWTGSWLESQSGVTS